MSLHSFWEKFDLLTDGPNGATKLRELILELAIRGKLVSQDPREKSASTFLREIASSNVNKRTGDTSDLTKSASIPFEIPQSWQWTSLLSLGHDWGQKKPNVEFTYIDVSSIDNEKGVITRKVKRMNPREAPSRARKIVKLGTVLYSTVRPYLLNIAIVDEEYSPEPIASTAFAVIHPFEGISAKYLFYYLRSRTFIDFVEQQMQGVAYPAIND